MNMKVTMMAVIYSMLTVSALAQPSTMEQQRTIHVTGEAEREVTPDIIYLSFSLKEFYRDTLNQEKVSLDVLEKQLYEAAMEAGVAHEDFMINNISSYNYEWNRKKDDPGFLAAKQYRIRVTDLNAVNNLFKAVEPRGIQHSYVDSYDYSGKKALEKELKIQAIKDAKERAEYLAEAVGDQVGKALTINESGRINYPQPVYPQAYRSVVAMAESTDMGASLDLDFKKVKFSFQVGVVFELL